MLGGFFVGDFLFEAGHQQSDGGQTMRRYLLVVLALSFSIGVSAGALGGEWETIAEEESPIVFQAPEGNYLGNLEKKRSQYSTTYAGSWHDMSGLHQLEMYMVALDPGRGFRRTPDLDSSIRGWRFFEDKKLEWLQKRTSIGRTKYRRFSTGSWLCFGFFQGWGIAESDWGFGATGENLQNFLTGYYCSKETLTDTELKAVIDGIKVRG